MYAYLKGIVTDVCDNQIVIEVNNIGYNVLCTTSLLENLPDKGEILKVYTYTSVREDAISLLGFASKEELRLFRMLITVSGIGPKGGLSILSTFSPQEIKYAIITGDAKKLAKAPGVGIKSAEHAISDLKKKLSDEGVIDYEPVSVETESVTDAEDVKDAIAALVALGYGMTESKQAVASARKDGVTGVEALLSAALRYF